MKEIYQTRKTASVTTYTKCPCNSSKQSHLTTMEKVYSFHTRNINVYSKKKLWMKGFQDPLQS